MATTLRLYAHVTHASTEALVDAIDARYGPRLRVLSEEVLAQYWPSETEIGSTAHTSPPLGQAHGMNVRLDAESAGQVDLVWAQAEDVARLARQPCDTATVGFCPLYALFHISTRSRRHDSL